MKWAIEHKNPGPIGIAVTRMSAVKEGNTNSVESKYPEKKPDPRSREEKQSRVRSGKILIRNRTGK